MNDALTIITSVGALTLALSGYFLPAALLGLGSVFAFRRARRRIERRLQHGAPVEAVVQEIKRPRGSGKPGTVTLAYDHDSGHYVANVPWVLGSYAGRRLKKLIETLMRTEPGQEYKAWPSELNVGDTVQLRVDPERPDRFLVLRHYMGGPSMTPRQKIVAAIGVGIIILQALYRGISAA